MSEWEKVKLQDVIDLIRNGTTEYQSDNVSEYPVTRIETISQGIIDYDRVRYLEKAKPEFQLISGDILYSHINSIQHIGKTAQYFAEKPLYHGMNLMLLRVKNEIDARFIFYILNTEIARRHSKNEAKPAINQASLGQKEILRFSFDLPSLLTEQRKIARILSTVDAVIEKTEAAIAKYEAIKKGMMADFFTRGIDSATGKLRPRYEDAPELYKETELGWVPKEWNVDTIQNVAKRIWIGLVTTMTTHYVESGIPLIRNNNIKENEIVTTNMIFLDMPFSEQNSQRYLREGDIVTVHTGDIGTSAIINSKLDPAHGFATINTTVNNKIVSSQYLCNFFNTLNFKNRIEAFATGDGRSNFNLYDYLYIKVPFPKNTNEQDCIAERMIAVEKAIKAEKAGLQKSLLLKQGLMADLLTGRVRVQVAEEPAAEMAEVANG